MTFGQHANIIQIFEHRWVKSAEFYFIDMELCDTTLLQYIDYHSDASNSDFDFATSLDDKVPAFIQRNGASLQRMQNFWIIASHIAHGLEFLHAHDQVHRDLKPANGTASLPAKG